MIDPLDSLVRYESGDATPEEAAAVEKRLASDPEAAAGLEWIRALRAAGEAGALRGDETGSPPDPIEVAALAEGTLPAARADEVRAALAACAEGYEMLAVALEEVRPDRGLRALPGGAARPVRRRGVDRGWMVAIAVAAAAAAALLLSILSSGAEGPPTEQDPAALASLVDRTPLPVPSLRSTAAPAGLAAYRDGDFIRAAEELAAAAVDAPKDGLVLLYLGSARRMAGDDRAALEPLARSREVAADSLAEEATWQLAHAHLALGRAGEAEALFEGIEAGPRAAEARAILEALRAR
ncbi:MAG: hypothetical protein AAGB93_01145 [Planctomycetota bacterium]